MFSTKTKSLVAAARGCALGALLGDCLGAAFEGHPARRITHLPRQHVAAPAMGLPVHVFGTRVGCYTDDSCAAAALLESLVENSGTVSGGDIAYRHARLFLDSWAHNFPRGCPHSALGMMAATVRGGSPQQCATSSFADGSYANGAAMKIWPLGILLAGLPAPPPPPRDGDADAEQISESGNGRSNLFYEAARTACCYSHCHPQAIDGAAVLSQAIAWASHYALGATTPATTDAAAARAGGGASAAAQLVQQTAQTTEVAWNAATDGQQLLGVAVAASRFPLLKEKLTALKHCLAALPPPPPQLDMAERDLLLSALRQHLFSGEGEAKSLSFQIETWAALMVVFAAVARYGPVVRDVVALTIALGGDTDTTASMAGALSGALVGLGSAAGEAENLSVFCTAEVFAALEQPARDWFLGMAAALAEVAAALPAEPLLPKSSAPSSSSSAPVVRARDCRMGSPRDWATQGFFDSAAELAGLFWSRHLEALLAGFRSASASSSSSSSSFVSPEVLRVYEDFRNTVFSELIRQQASPPYNGVATDSLVVCAAPLAQAAAIVLGPLVGGGKALNDAESGFGPQAGVMLHPQAVVGARQEQQQQQQNNERESESILSSLIARRRRVLGQVVALAGGQSAAAAAEQDENETRTFLESRHGVVVSREIWLELTKI